MTVLIIGESCNDIFHYGDCNRLCPEAPVPVFNSIKTNSNGGMAMNVYNNFISLGGRAEIHTNKNWKDISKTRFVDIRTNHMFMRLDQNDKEYGTFNINDIDFSKYEAVIVSDYNKGYMSKKDLKKISEAASLTFLDTKKNLGSWSDNFSFIKINNFEYEKTKDTITHKTKRNLIVTRGSNGCEYRDTIYKVKLVEVKDTSGAGDTFIASLCYKYCETKDIGASIIFANECATKVVQKMGVAIA
jgi:D-beta-D-heptose 7-phosphate kinase/D-beta-D-heptose 1-phosphate adenosyltransferase